MMRVLIADDQAWLRSAMRLLLEQETSLEVVGEAADTNALLNATKALTPDLILLDWELPGFGALEEYEQVLQALRTEWPALKIIALSVNLDAQSIALGIGVDAFIDKSKPPEYLLSAVRRIEQMMLHNPKWKAKIGELSD